MMVSFFECQDRVINRFVEHALCWIIYWQARTCANTEMPFSFLGQHVGQWALILEGFILHFLHTIMFLPPLLLVFAFFSISMSLKWHYQFHYSQPSCARLASRDLWCSGPLSDSNSLKLGIEADGLSSIRVKAVLYLQTQVNTAERKCATYGYQQHCTRETSMLAVI